MDRLMETKLILVLASAIYLLVYEALLSDFSALTRSTLFGFTVPVTVALAIIVVMWLPFDWAVEKITA